MLKSSCEIKKKSILQINVKSLFFHIMKEYFKEIRLLFPK